MKIIGGGGHAKVVREVIGRMGLILDDTYGFIAVGDNASRKRKAAQNEHLLYATLIDPSAVVSPSATVGYGTVIMAGVVVQAEAFIGKFVILNTGCSVDHESVVENFCHIGPGVSLCGDVIVGEGALVGVGACAVPGANIKAWSVVKAGETAK